MGKKIVKLLKGIQNLAKYSTRSDDREWDRKIVLCQASMEREPVCFETKLH